MLYERYVSGHEDRVRKQRKVIIEETREQAEIKRAVEGILRAWYDYWDNLIR